MLPDIGKQYDEIADWWNDYHQNSDYGVAALERALRIAGSSKLALDVGCGAGGRLIRKFEAQKYHITGIDASPRMIELARQNHRHLSFICADIIGWQPEGLYDFILAWDSLFHLPLKQQEPVLSKLCKAMKSGGVLLYSFGDAEGSHSDEWRRQIFHYSSLGVTRNLEILHEHGMRLRHMELDQYPEKHAYIIAQKN